MAVVQTRYERVERQEPFNPHQHTVIKYAGLPGGWHSWFFNEIPNVTHLMGAGEMPSVMTLERPGPGSAQLSPEYVQLMGSDESTGSMTKILLVFAAAVGIAAVLGIGLGKLRSSS